MDILATAKQWLDWAFGTFSASRYDDAQYNLNQFQEIYLANYWQVDDATRKELETMNARALTLQSMLQERKTWAIPSEWWAPFVPGTTASQITEAGTAAQQAAKLAAQQAHDVGSTRLEHQAMTQGAESAVSMNRELADAPNAYTDFLKMNFMGLPVWAWGIGAAVLLVVVVKK